MLEVQNLSVNYRSVQALENVQFKLHPGELVGLIGPNGAGKSTLLKALLGLIPVNDGQILFHEHPVRRLRHRIAYVPQRSQIDWDYPITAWNVVMMAQTPSLGWFRSPSPSAQRRALEALDRVEMLQLRNRQIGELSGGQQQRVFLARALAQEADLFFFDEPFTGIDRKTEAIMLRVFDELKSLGKTLLVCSHEWGDALRRYDRLLLLNRQLLANDHPDQVMTLENIQRAYGSNLTPAQRAEEAFLFC
ncbi:MULTISPECIES: ABC transporter ATP-binding protein [unclassified Leptolyngbya]|uniref:metal ABC transporter ATP-binding protein n=1 Tax=unclassified Leptolyngbya TaxID=2650499 RepID=UPI001687662D|nr:MULTISPECIES: ABC transporter ATP-binding protein [unclassified Leptolyngbya]MBD1913783.1 ABC transporter ATP-binding protein [Leptolyngbya sp. FACHB-8]MBD2156133.1 ABC transporter ATP-binding protein [Leptolyngbya sp. FACHB-16]